MADQLKLRGGPTDAQLKFTGAEREISVDTDLKTIRVHDGVTPGGWPIGAGGGNSEDKVALINKGPFTGDCNVPSSVNLSTQLDLNAWVTSAIQILDTELCALKVIVDSYDDRFDLIELDIAVIKQNIANIEENIDDLQKLVADLELEVEKNQQDITDNSVAIGKLEAEFNNIQQDIEDIKNELDTLTLDWGDITNKPTEFPPADHSHSYNDLADKPTIGDGLLTINNSDGSKAGEFTANQTGNSVVVLPAGFSGSWDDLTDVPTEFPPAAHEHSLDDLSDVNVAGAAAGQRLVFRGSEWVAEDDPFVNQAVHFKGFIDVGGDTAPSANPGDTYIQHRADEADAVAGSSWTGIEGATAKEGQYVIYGADNKWHKGTTVENVDQVQSDWLVSDTSSAAYIDNKPDIQDLINGSLPTVNDGTLTIKDSGGVTVGTFTANQAGSTDVTLPQGFSGNYSDLNGTPTEFPPSVHGHDYSEISNTPTIGDGTLTIKNSDGSTLGSFSANQTSSSVVNLPAQIDAYTKTESDDRYLSKNIALLPALP